jgi:hypothetical protein
MRSVDHRDHPGGESTNRHESELIAELAEGVPSSGAGLVPGLGLSVLLWAIAYLLWLVLRG